MTSTTLPRPASTKQVEFIQRLVGEKNVPADHLDWITGALGADAYTTASASKTITYLLSLPSKPESREEAKPGYYTLNGEAIKVQSNKAGTHTYALVWTGTRWDYRPGKVQHLRNLRPMSAEEAAALGLASGRCINCCKVLGGETLSAKVSALIGYGETCADHNGWHYPKGVKAQRAYVEARTEREAA